MYKSIFHTTHTILAVLFIVSASAKSSHQHNDIPLCFIENKGQVTNRDGEPMQDISFSVLQAQGLTVFIGGNGILHYQFSKAKNARVTKSICEAATPLEYDMSRLDVTLEGANQNAAIETGRAEAFKANYLKGGSGGSTSAARSFDKITFKNIYHDIDWVLYLKEAHLEYDFIVHPGGNPADIKFKYDGASRISEKDGQITAFTPLGWVRESGLHCYASDTKNDIAAQFSIENSRIGFTLPVYSGTVIIDPTLEWGTYFGGTEAIGQVLANGDNGSIYMAGCTTSVTNIATTGAFQTTYNGDNDAFLSKFDSSGSLLWSTYFGGSANDEAHGIVYDAAGNIYMGGLTTSNTGIATAGAWRTGYAGGGGDAFLAKFTTSGSLAWATYFGGSGAEICNGVSIDKNENIFITGYTYSTDSIATAGAYKTTGGGSTVDVYIAKFNPSGVLQWATYYGGSDDDEAMGIACDTAGSVYVTGGTSSTDSIATPGAYQLTYQSYDDAGFLVKFSNNGSLQWGTYYGANGSNGVHGIISDHAGNVYITGSTSCSDSIATPGAYQGALVGPANAFLAKFNAAGNILWGTYFGQGGEGGNGLATDAAGNIYITGVTTSSSGIATTGAYQSANAGGEDAFLAGFSNTGTLSWATYYGGPSQDVAYGAAISGSNIFITGYTTSTAGIATPGSLDSTNMALGLNEDAFLAKFGNGPGLHLNTNAASTPTQKIQLSPNPASNEIRVSWPGCSCPVVEISILNMLGETVYRMTSDAQSKSINIPLTNLQEGAYQCVAQYETSRFCTTFIVKK